MATPTQPRRGFAVLGAACAKLLFCFERTRVSRALPPAWTPVLRRGHPARPGVVRIAWATAIAVALTAAALPAQAQFVSLTGFGDSYADTGAAPGGAFRLMGPAYYPNCPAPLNSCRFTGSTNFVELAAIDLRPAGPDQLFNRRRANRQFQHHTPAQPWLWLHVRTPTVRRQRNALHRSRPHRALHRRQRFVGRRSQRFRRSKDRAD